MADIDVVRKGGMPMWVWFLVAALVVVGLVALMNRGGDADERTSAPHSQHTPAVGATPVALV